MELIDLDLNDNDIFDQSEANDSSDMTHSVSVDRGPPGSGHKNKNVAKKQGLSCAQLAHQSSSLLLLAFKANLSQVGFEL